jgi:glycosyltransferase involved in cell wall biosynthesis
MKRICIVKNSYYTGLTPERRNARALVSHGYEVDIICLKKKGEKSQEIIEGMKVYRLPVEHHRRGFFRYVFEYSAFFLMAFVKLAWLSLRRRYKVVQVSGIPHFLIFTAIVPRLLGAKVIFYILDHTPHVYMEHFGVGTSHRMVKLLNMFEGISARWADYCIGTQIINKQLLEKHGVPDDKISVILNVPDEGFSNNHDRIGSNNHHFSLITHGSLLERYGVQTLIKAVPLLTGEIPQLKVKIVGDGEYKRKLEELAHSLGGCHRWKCLNISRKPISASSPSLPGRIRCCRINYSNTSIQVNRPYRQRYPRSPLILTMMR